MSSYFSGESKNSSPFTRKVSAPAPRVPGYMYSGSPGSDAARAPYFAPVDPVTPTKSPTAKPGGGSQTPPAGGGGQSIYDLSTDPIVQKIRDLNTRNFGSSVAGADASRKQALIDAGFSDLAGATQFGGLDNPVVGDQATALAAAANPYSIAAELARQHLQTQTGIDQNTNRANLFFSSTRGNQLGDEAHQYLGNVSSARGTLVSKLQEILAGLVSARTQAQGAEADAIAQARQNAIQNALASGQTFVGYDSNGNPIFGKPGQQQPTIPAADTAVAPAAVPQGQQYGGANGPYIGTLPGPGPASTDPQAALTQLAAARVKKLLGLDG